MALFEKIRGIVGSLFQIGGPDGNQIENGSGYLAARDSAGTGWAKVRAGDVPTSSSDPHDLVNLLNVRGRVALIEFAFDGGSPPTPGVNTSKFGMCHTSGGSYTAGRIYYDTGAALQWIPDEVAAHVTTVSAFTGTVSMIANGFYAREGASWVLKGDVVATGVGLVRTIEVPYAYSDDGTPKLSTTAIEDGARVLRCWNKVETPFNAGNPTVLVEVHGASADEIIMDTDDSKIKHANTYLVPEVTPIDSTTAGQVRVTVNKDGSTAGAGRIVVEYVKPYA